MRINEDPAVKAVAREWLLDHQRAVTFAGPSNGLPPGIRYNGPQNVGSKTIMMFTDSETGDTFSLPPSEADYANITAAATQRRATRNQQAMRAATFAPPISL